MCAIAHILFLVPERDLEEESCPEQCRRLAERLTEDPRVRPAIFVVATARSGLESPAIENGHSAPRVADQIALL